MAFIAAIETAVPQYCYTQDDMIDFFVKSTDDDMARRKIEVVAKKSAIQRRYSVLKDFSGSACEYEFFPKNDSLEPAPSLTQRMQLFKTEAVSLSLKAVQKIRGFEEIKHSITHIITVTCTGLFAPGLDIELIHLLGLSPTTQRSSINFMGCNAAILALKNADAICNTTPDAKVLVVCVELCSIHFQKDYSDDYILSNSLFADGSAAVLIESAPPEGQYYHGLKVDSFNSMLIHKGHSDMTWQLSESGFIMNLSSYVSDLINGSMEELLNSLDVYAKNVTLWAVHPGGKKILDDFANVLNLKKESLKHSYDVLANYGNMSSPTVLFVLKQVIENNMNAPKGTNIFSVAFGPGISIETMQIEYV